MNTNTLIFREKVRRYVTDILDTEDDFKILRKKVEAAFEEFNYFYNDYEKTNQPNRKKAFIEWLGHDPFYISPEIYYDDMRKLLQEWHEQDDETAAKYTDEQVANAYSNLVYREFVCLLSTHYQIKGV